MDYQARAGLAAEDHVPFGRRSHSVVLCSTAAALGRSHAAQTVTVHVSGAALAIEFADGDTRVIRRTTTQPVRSIKGQQPRTAAIS